MKPVWHVDLETRSPCNLITHGLPRYARDPDTKVLLVGVGIDDDDPICVDLTCQALPAYIAEGLCDPGILKMAFNAPFEFEILQHVLGLPVQRDQWMDVAVLARSMSIPGTLAAVGEALGLPEHLTKQTFGKDLIRYFSIPRPKVAGVVGSRSIYNEPKDDPEKWQLFKEYNLQDVVAERAIFEAIRPYLKYTYRAADHQHWLLDQTINDAGLPVDLELVDSALEVDRKGRERLMAHAQTITGLDNPNSAMQLKAWLESRGLKVPDMTKATVASLLHNPELSDGVRTVLQIRQQLAQTSTKKFASLADRANDDGRLRGAFQYMGAARTGRWSGSGFQPQNLASASLGGSTPEQIQADLTQAVRLILSEDPDTLDMVYGSYADALKACLRGAIAAPCHNLLCVADLASIETVVIGWLSGCTRILHLFRNGLDAYKDFASDVFQVPYRDVSKAQRKFAKPPVLGCGFGLGAKGLAAYAEAFGVDLSEMWTENDRVLTPVGLHASSVGGKRAAVGQRLVNTYRSAYYEVPAWWAQLRNASFRAVQDGGEHSAGSVTYFKDGGYLFCRLPSGRHLCYVDPRVEYVQHPEFGEVQTLSYMGTNQKTRKWERLHTHKGKLAENCVQAVARDLLVEGLQHAAGAGLEIVGHVHDEILTLVPDTAQITRRQASLNQLIECMTRRPAWAPNIPINAAGWVGERYMKD